MVSVKQFALAYGVDLDNFNEAERQKLTSTIDSRAAELGITQENIKDLAKEYGIDLSNYSTKEAQKIAVSNAIIRKQISLKQAELALIPHNGDANQMPSLKTSTFPKTVSPPIKTRIRAKSPAN